MPLCLKIFKSQVAQSIQIAHGKQAGVDLLTHFRLSAGANLQPAKLRVPYGQVGAHVALTPAVWASRVAQRGGRHSRIEISVR